MGAQTVDEIEGIWDTEITLKDADTELAVPETIMLYRLNEETGELVEDMNAYHPGGTVYIPLLDWDVKSGTDYGRVWKKRENSGAAKSNDELRNFYIAICTKNPNSLKKN